MRHTYTPEMLEQIEYVCKDPSVRIYSQLKKSAANLNEIESFLTTICSFLKENQSELGALDYILRLNFSNLDIKTKLSVKHITNALKSDSKVIEINRNLSVLSTSKIQDFSNSGIAIYSQKNKCVSILVHNGTDVTIYIKGIPAKELNINFPLSSPRVNKRMARSSKEYRLSIIDFYNNRVKYNVTNHWHDKTKRILKGGKTEDIFQDSLANWLDENISDGIAIPKVKKISKDETDIEIKAYGGNSYLIEIKWLGSNEKSRTPYDESRLRDSITQVVNYLEIDKEVLDATLVVYDGRELPKFNKLKHITLQKNEWKEVKECLRVKLPSKGSCYVFYLISQSASTRKN